MKAFIFFEYDQTDLGLGSDVLFLLPSLVWQKHFLPIETVLDLSQSSHVVGSEQLVKLGSKW